MTESDEDIQKLSLHLRQIEELKAAINANNAPTEFELSCIDDEIKREREEFEKRIAEKRARKQQLELESFDAKRKLRQIQADVDQVQRKLDQALAAKAAEAELAAKAKERELVTAGAPWREWAKDHQISGAHFLTNAKRGILADSMGLGKTLTLTATLDMITAEGAGNRILYYTPAPVLRNVVREIKRWAPHRTVVLMGGQDKRTRRFQLEILADTPKYVVVLNYEASRKDNSLIDDLISLKFDTIIVDEAHNIKDRSTKAYKDIKRLIFNDQHEVPYVFLATGTPILNRPQELYSLLHLIDPYTFYNEYTFLSDYCQQVWDNSNTPKWTFKPGGLDLLAHKIRNRYLRRDRHSAGIKLPPQTVQIHEIELDELLYPKQYKAYIQMRDTAMLVLDPERNRGIRANIILTWYLRLRQLMVWPDGIEVKDPEGDVLLKLDVQESCKIDYIIRKDIDNEWEGLLPELSGERVAIFSQFKPPLRELYQRCKDAGLRVVVLDGDTPDNVRDRIAIDFDRATCGENPVWDIVLCNYRVGGIGLNFTACTQTIILDEEWNPGKRDQAYGRTDRIGQTEETTVHVLRVSKVGDKGGIDTWLAGLIEHKEQMIEGFESATDMPNPYDAFSSGLI